MARIDGPPYRGVLRYMPLRRCTMLSFIEQRTATPMIVKFKRPHRLAASWALLNAVHAALGDGRAGFDLPAPLGLDPPVAYSGQTVLGGEDLSTIADADLLRRAGALHRAMHAADVPGIPPEDPAQALAELRADARWVAFALPEHADAVRAVMAVLEPRTPRAPRVPAFCHGDLVPSQMLVGERWAITDFDGARTGDPHRDLAIWLASLTSDVPALRAAAEAGDDAAVAQAEGAYLDGYGAHDEARLLWHRGAAELHYAAVALKKDRYHPARLARGLRLARACAETLER
jgi:hypothetical protein